MSTHSHKLPSVGTSSASAAPNQTEQNRQEGGLKNSLHGVSYQLKLILMVVLQASKLMREDAGFACTISTEDPDEGKFDDIVFRYRYRGSARVLSIQAKHKSSEQEVSWADLSSSSTNAPFAIVKYFKSFLEQREHDQKTEQRMVLCTNADLHDTVKAVLEADDTRVLKETDICYIFKLIESTCYRFDLTVGKDSKELHRIVELLKESSDCYGLGKLLASTIYNETKLDLNTRNAQRSPLLTAYRNAIVCHILGDRREKTIHSLKAEFCDGTLSSGGTHLRSVFEAEYNKLAGDGVDVWADVTKKGITLKEALKPTKDSSPTLADCVLPEDLVTGEDIDAFFNKFLLVCGSRGEDELSQTVMEFWKQANAHEPPTGPVADGEKNAAYNEMLRVVFDWMKEQKQPPTPLTRADIEALFERIGFGIEYPELRAISRMYRDSMELGKHQLAIKQQRIEQTPLFKFLTHHDGQAICPLSFPHNSKFATEVVWEVLQLFQKSQREQEKCELLFMDCAMYQRWKKSIKGILRLKNIRLVLVIVCTDERLDLLNKLEKHLDTPLHEPPDCWKKIILIEQYLSSSIGVKLDAHLLVSDLTGECKERLLGKTLTLFGTEVLLSNMVEEGDDLMKLLELLESFCQLEMEPSLVEEQYEQIQDWYVRRSFMPYRSKPDVIVGIRKLLDSTCFRKGETMLFGAFFDTLKRELRLNLFDDWQVKFLMEEHYRKKPFDPPGFRDDPAVRVHVVLDEAGFGKSTCMTWLGWCLQRENPTSWIVRLNAIEYSTDFEQILKRGARSELHQPTDDTQALRVLFQLVHLAQFVRGVYNQSVQDSEREREKAEACASLLTFERGKVVLDEAEGMRANLSALQLIVVRLFRAKFNAAQLVVLFDGFDEIVPYYKEVVYGLFARWQAFDGIHKIYLTSRPYQLKREFEEMFNDRTLYYQLRPFDMHARLVLIHILLKSKFELYERCEVPQRNELLGSLEAIVRCYLSELRHAPLFIRMGMEILAPLVERHVDFRNGTICERILDAINTSFEKLHMIETFVKNKLHIASVEKPQTTDPIRKTAHALDNTAELNKWTHRMHSALALFVLFNGNDRKKFLSEREEADALEYMEKVKQGSVKSGIIEGVVGQVPLFVHRVFVDYFVADWIYRQASLGGGAHTHFCSVVDLRWFGNSRSSLEVEVQEFYDRMLIRDGGSKPLHVATINRSLLDIRNLLQQDLRTAYDADAGGRTFLHLLVIYMDDQYCKKKTSILQTIVQLFDKGFIDRKDRLRDWSALDYAFALDRTCLIRLLIKRGATINVDTLFQQIVSHSFGDGETILHRALLYEKRLANFPFASASKQYMRKVPCQVVQHLLLAKELELEVNVSEDAWRCYRTPLGVCVEHDAVGMFRCLVKQAGGLRKVPVDRLLRKALVDHAVHVIHYLVVECRYGLPPYLVGRALLWLLTRSIQCHYRDLLPVLLKRFCRPPRKSVRTRISRTICTTCRSFRHTGDADGETEEELDEYYETKLHEPWTFESVPPIDPCLMQLLCTCVVSGSVHAVKRLLQASGITVTNDLIVGIMVALCNKVEPPSRSGPPLVCLINRSKDLRTVDGKRRTLLHAAIESGWVSAAKHLIDRKAFVASESGGGGKRWNGFHWCASRHYHHLHSWQQAARVELFRYMLAKWPVDDTPDNGVLQLAVRNRHFPIAQCIVEAKLQKEEGFEQQSAAVRDYLKDCNLYSKEECQDFLEWLSTEGVSDVAGFSWTRFLHQTITEWMKEKNVKVAMDAGVASS